MEELRVSNMETARQSTKGVENGPRVYVRLRFNLITRTLSDQHNKSDEILGGRVVGGPLSRTCASNT